MVSAIRDFRIDSMPRGVGALAVVRTELRPKLNRVGLVSALLAAQLQQRDLVVIMAARFSGRRGYNHESY